MIKKNIFTTLKKLLHPSMKDFLKAPKIRLNERFFRGLFLNNYKNKKV